MVRVLLAGALAVAGCGPARDSPEARELYNLRPWNAVPASAPARLVGVFEQVCLDGPRAPDAAARALRAMDYVEAPAVGDDAMRSFVVDDNRPLVMLAPDGRGCAVAAEARTGQSARLAALVARRFPDARPVDPATIAPAAALAWDTGTAQGLIVLQAATTPPGHRARVIVARIGPG
ncbi:MAG: hypothetical protein H5U20_03985 [Rhodobacteraceae bacterium]|nr:hypothetical protein [Paracoccaceae bacterium]